MTLNPTCRIPRVHRPSSLPTRCRCAAAAGLLGLLPALAGAQPLDLSAALERARGTPDAVRSARLEAEAKGLQAEALQHLNRPSVSLSGFAGRVGASFNLDTSQLAATLNPVIGAIDAGMGQDVPLLPSSLAMNRVFDLRSLSLSAAIPIYTGGRLDAVHEVALGRAAEAQADLQEAQEQNATTVAQRYFSVQLAQQVWEVRRSVLAGVQQHAQAAQRLEQAGLIARAERLKADVALADAQRELSKSDSDREIARTALTRMLELPAPAETATPLFVHAAAPGSLQSFIDAAMRGNVAWRRIAAKRDQADAGRRLVGTEYGPTVLGVGTYNFNRSRDQAIQPTWFAGVMLRVPLVSPVDKGKSLEAARLEEERVRVASSQAERDIPTLAESQWRTMENARAQVLSMTAHLALARENLRLQQVSFEQRQSVPLDVIDAELNLARVRVQRCQSAYDYVMALARLLEISGDTERLPELARNAEHKIVSALE